MLHFSNLKYGWATLTIGEFTCRCSYIQDLPSVIINAYKDFKEKGYCIITIDNEGYETEVILSKHGVHAIVYKDYNIYYDLTNQYSNEKESKTLIIELLKDIVDNVDEWSKWLACEPTYESSIDYYRNRINNMLFAI